MRWLVDFLIVWIQSQLWDLSNLRFLSVSACCDSRWKFSGCWSSPKHQETQFSNNLRPFCAKVLPSECTHFPGSPWKSILHQGLCWFYNAFVLAVWSGSRKSNRLELQCGISKQLLHEWQSQGLVIRTWENPGGAGGEEPAAAAELLCSAVFGVRQLTLLLLCGVEKCVRSLQESSLSSLSTGKYWHYLTACAPNTPLYLAHLAADLMTVWKLGGGVQKTGSWKQGWRNGVEGQKKGKWIPGGLFLVLTAGLVRATRLYCSSDTPSTTGSLWRTSAVSQQVVSNTCDGLSCRTKLLLFINGAFTL